MALNTQNRTDFEGEETSQSNGFPRQQSTWVMQPEIIVKNTYVQKKLIV